MKVLFITSTRLGDAILSTGLLNHVLLQHPNAQVTVACGPLPLSIFEGFPNVVEILAMKKQKCHGHWFQLWKKVVGTKWDMVIDLRDSIVSRAIHAKQRYIFTTHIDKTKHKCEQAAQVMGLEERQINGIAKGTPGEVAAALARCNLYIGNDSGLMHAAAAANIPTVGLFGPSYPHLYAPWGKHTTYARTPEGFDQLIDFKGYSSKTLDRTLMDSLKTQDVIDIINEFYQDKLSSNGLHVTNSA